MDASQLVGVVGGYIAMALTITGAIYAAVNHKRLRSNCCGAKGEISLDVDTMSAASAPSPKTPTGVAPMTLSEVHLSPA